MATSDSLIQVKNLKKHYHRGAIKALDGVTADINKGDVMVVIGPSGSGKSTFLRSLNLLEEPTDGEIIFNGVDITKKKYKDASGKTVKLDIDGLRQKMGMVFQHFNLFPHMTILDNMTLAPMKVKGVSKFTHGSWLLSFFRTKKDRNRPHGQLRSSWSCCVLVFLVGFADLSRGRLRPRPPFRPPYNAPPYNAPP